MGGVGSIHDYNDSRCLGYDPLGGSPMLVSRYMMESADSTMRRIVQRSVGEHRNDFATIMASDA